MAVATVSLGAPLGFGLGAPLLAKVSHAPAEYTHVRPEVTVQAPEYQYKSVPVPVPVAQPYYTAPVVRNFVAAPAVATAYHHPAPYAALPAFHHYALPAAATTLIA